MEEFGQVKRPQPAPSNIPAFPEELHSSVPSPEDAVDIYRRAGAEDALQGLQRLIIENGDGNRLAGDGRHASRSAMPFSGGETAGHQRLQEILHGSQSSRGELHPKSTLPAEARRSTAVSEGVQLDSKHEDKGWSFAQVDSSTPAAALSRAQGASDVAETAGSGAANGHSSAGSDNSSAVGQEARQALIHNFKDTRMLAGGVNNSAKLSAYLAAGCLSPRQVYWSIKDAAEQHCSDTGHSWLIMHLIIRCMFPLSAVYLLSHTHGHVIYHTNRAAGHADVCGHLSGRD